VVIAIIGLLASIILASLNTARQKGRDARRVADLKEMANALEASNSGTASVALTGCTTALSLASTCGISGNATLLAGYADPSGVATACLSTPNAVCNYTEKPASANTQTYEVCAYLEAGSGSIPAGPVYVSGATSGSVEAGCP
jgi:type II secretory pathway pseudopilin PulG